MNILYDKIKKVQEKIKENNQAIKLLESQNRTINHKLNDRNLDKTFILSLLDDKRFKDGHNLKLRSKLYAILALLLGIAMLGLIYCVAFFQVMGSSLLQLTLESLGIIFSCWGTFAAWNEHEAYEKLIRDIQNSALTDKYSDIPKKSMTKVDLLLVKRKLGEIENTIDTLNNSIENNKNEISSLYDIKSKLVQLVKKIETEGTNLQEPMNKVIEENMTDELKDDLLNADNLLEKKVLVKERV